LIIVSIHRRATTATVFGERKVQFARALFGSDGDTLSPHGQENWFDRQERRSERWQNRFRAFFAALLASPCR